ncbi:MAG: tRNA (adenosine(37)-N6)-threonylcarbamoyltransferase complex dimerization subunit type 1 TsaB [Neisseriaceae bacterium]
MNILAIDTSSEYLSIGLQYQNKRSYILEKVGNKQSDFIIPKIQVLLKECGATIDKVDVIAYNQGPGSFTGLRIGLSVAIGMAYPGNTKLIPIPGFAIYAQSIKNLVQDKNILIAIDARLNQTYFAGIDTTKFEYFINPQVINPNDIDIPNDNLVCVGSGFKQYYSLLPEKVKKLEFIDAEYPNALNMIQLVEKGCYAKISVYEADLLYLRNKVALNLEEQKQSRSK